MNNLNPLTLDLTQNSLIEASAGTGKTYTISTLYLRAVLGLLKQEGQLSPYDVKQLLVVTFTEAATKELKDRIRAKLVEAQSYIISSQSGESISADPNLIKVIADYQSRCLTERSLSPEKANLSAYIQLQNALLLIDEASIFTIHGFCHRCLTQFAFETQTDFEQKMEVDYLPTQNKALYDFWRRSVLAIEGLEFCLFANSWQSPESLLKLIDPILGKQIEVLPDVQDALYSKQLNSFSDLLNQVKVKWLECNFSDIVLQSGINGKLNIKTKLSVIEPFLNGEIVIPEFPDKVGWFLWGSEMLHDTSKYNKNKPCIEHEIISLIDQLITLETEFVNSQFVSYWVNKAKQDIEQIMTQTQHETQVITPDDLLTSLAVALDKSKSVQSERASSDKLDVTSLIPIIRQRYPLAFIDEFQDTDPIQYQIFSSLYLPNELNEEGERANVVLIGDPKQAIYKFRGADIYTYIRAKQDIPKDRHFTLDKNWRSHPELISAVNYLFESSAHQFEHQAIPFIPVSAGKEFSPTNTPINRDTSIFEVMHLLTEEGQKEINPDTGYENLAKWCTADIVMSLNKVDPVVTGDICVLVRSRSQAKLMKRHLNDVGLDSVYLSRDSIFSSKLAKTLYLLLLAIHAPHNEKHVKTALATDIFCLTVDELLQLQNDPNKWQQKLNWFYTANNELHKSSLYNAVEYLLNKAESYNKWSLDESTFNRKVTDVRHLIELLQTKVNELSGIEKLILWFEQQIATPSDNENNDEKSLRLETDSNLIKIVTYHASKGLEYPYVYLPFICQARMETNPIYTSEQQHKTFYRADKRQIELQRAEQERLSEDIRILYVCLTRPVYRIAIGLFNVKGKSFDIGHTAICKLLFGEKPSGSIDGAISDYFSKMSVDLASGDKLQSRGIVYQSMAEHEIFDKFTALKSMKTDGELLPRREFSHRQYLPKTKEDWRIVSYSLISKQIEHGAALNSNSLLSEVLIENGGLTTDEGQIEELAEPSVNKTNAKEPLQPQQEMTRFQFPKGANAGTCLHWILENIEFTKEVADQTHVIKAGLDKFSISGDWVGIVTKWMQEVVSNSGGGFKLMDLKPSQFINEMEFYFNFNGLNSSVLSNALSMLGLDELSDKVIKSGFKVDLGIVKGFIDVVVEHNGRFYVVDYKSNYLGDSLDDYAYKKLHLNMVSHQYHLQALLYVLALHRYLKNVVADYDFEKHIGNATYMFLRGMGPESGGVYSFEFNQEVINYLDDALQNSSGKSVIDKRLSSNRNELNDVNSSHESKQGQWDF